MTICCVINHGTVAERTGDNEWYVVHGAWEFSIVDDDHILIHHSKKEIKQTTIYVFDGENLSKCGDFTGGDITAEIKEHCAELKWNELPPYEAPKYDDNDDIAF